MKKPLISFHILIHNTLVPTANRYNAQRNYSIDFITLLLTVTELCRNYTIYCDTKSFVYWNALTGGILCTVSKRRKLLQMGIWACELKTLKMRSHICVHTSVSCLNRRLVKVKFLMREVHWKEVKQTNMAVQIPAKEVKVVKNGDSRIHYLQTIMHGLHLYLIGVTIVQHKTMLYKLRLYTFI